MKPTSLQDFYDEITQRFPAEIGNQIGHFNVFRIADLQKKAGGKSSMPYDRRAYYKISLIIGRNRAEYADKVIEIEKSALLFATPKIPYHYLPYDDQQTGQFCIFTSEFLTPANSGIVLDDLPLFKSGGYPVFELTNSQTEELRIVFEKMQKELVSDYAFKYDLLRNYLQELIHYGQKLQPATALYPPHNASARVSSLFLELLERQFPIESVDQQLRLRTAKDFADALAVHVNHLNKVLKENTGHTTTDLIAERVVREAKIILKQTSWNVSEISYCLGFEQLAHFSNFFRKHTQLSPMAYRS
ncbi:AraC family transcriptional regulator [Dyadobacter luteus]|uniref:AraC family transcriptional regulator n=1 Tax=Dyadobacter luteus TaxID=2259619 RepID=A0A3D8YF14_9BACT|nr:AraC family transcriptional regulator [Dyadobacter luteus]REA63075.1 AraC family transcriptional regulator [Dyadobacter luteus]